VIALVLGGAACVWDDLQATKAFLATRPHIIVACNYAGRDCPEDIAALCTEHADLLTGWRAKRQGNADYRAFVAGPHWTCPDAEVVPERWPGSSGLYAVQIALTEMQCAAAILCGMPLDHEAGHFDRPGPWSDTAHFRQGFGQALPTIGGRVRSIGGWTAELFGSPTAAWLSAIADTRPLSEPTSRPKRDPMHHVRNVSDATQRFHVTDENGMPSTASLEPGGHGYFDINPAQAAFATGELKVSEREPPAPKASAKARPRASTRASKPKATPKPAEQPAPQAAQPADPDA
jgi:hypothetical protein